MEVKEKYACARKICTNHTLVGGVVAEIDPESGSLGSNRVEQEEEEEWEEEGEVPVLLVFAILLVSPLCSKML